MNRSNKSKFSVTLLSALAFGANSTSAMNSGIKTSGNLATKSSSFSTSKDSKLSPKSSQSVGTVSILEKVLIGAGITFGTAASFNETMASIMWAKNKQADSILKGKYSLINFLRTKIKKDDNQHPKPGEQDDKDLKNKPGEQDDKDLKNKKQEILLRYVTEKIRGQYILQKRSNAKYSDIDVEKNLNDVLELLRSIAATEVINSDGYEDLKSFIQADFTYFFRALVVSEDNTTKYFISFERDGNTTGYLMYKSDSHTGVNQSKKFDHDWKNTDDIPNRSFKLIK